MEITLCELNSINGENILERTLRDQNLIPFINFVPLSFSYLKPNSQIYSQIFNL